MSTTESRDTPTGKNDCCNEDDDSSGTTEITNVRPIIENKDLWLTLIHTTSSGLSLLARTEDGEITDWVVHDRSGHPVPTVVYQQKPKNGGKKKTCRICVTIAGETNCWEVPCDKIVILPKMSDQSDGGDIEVHDIHAALKQLPSSDGVIPVYTTPSGVRFSVRIENGNIDEWLAFDSAGKELPTTVYQKKPKKPKGDPIKCNVCTTTNGKTECVEVPCEKIIILK
ncbi:MAG: hypothetical protein V4632_15030 [Pseudomonadota bacterium]